MLYIVQVTAAASTLVHGLQAHLQHVFLTNMSMHVNWLPYWTSEHLHNCCKYSSSFKCLELLQLLKMLSISAVSKPPACKAGCQSLPSWLHIYTLGVLHVHAEVDSPGFGLHDPIHHCFEFLFIQLVLCLFLLHHSLMRRLHVSL